MSAASDRIAEIQAMSPAQRLVAQKQCEDDLKAARERWRAEETKKTEALQQERYEFVAGGPRRYVGVKSVEGGVEFEFAEWTTLVASATLNHEESLALIEAIREIIK